MHRLAVIRQRSRLFWIRQRFSNLNMAQFVDCFSCLKIIYITRKQVTYVNFIPIILQIVSLQNFWTWINVRVSLKTYKSREKARECVL